MLKVLLAAILLYGCSWDDLAPDQFTTSYGMGMQGDGSFNAWDPVHLDTGDFELITVGLAWDIGPRQVEIVEPLSRPLSVPVSEPVAIPLDPEAESDMGIQEAVEAFTTMDLASRIMLVVVLLWLSFLYRAQLGRLIPKFGNGKG